MYKKWHPTALMEFAKTSLQGGKYNLGKSSVPSFANLSELPRGTFEFRPWGMNMHGHEGLKSVLADWYGASTDNILIAQGSSQANFLIAGSLLADGGTLIVETPTYEPVLRGLEVFADKLIRLPRRKENNYQPDPAEFRKLLTTETKMVWLTNLQNPTGIAIEQSCLEEIVGAAEKVGAKVVVDEVYFAMHERNHRKHAFSVGAISTNSLNKSWGFESLRVGWAVGPKEIINRAYRLNNLMGVNQPFISEDLAYQIISHEPSVNFMIDKANERMKNRDMLETFLRDTPEATCILPSSGLSALIDLPDEIDDMRFSRELFDKFDTTVFPASLFECPGSIRVSFSQERDITKEGLSRLSSFIKSYS